MLQQMRKFAKSWVSSIFLGVLALSFGVWGIADIFKGNTDTTVATIGDVKIAQETFQSEYRNALRNQSARLGAQITPEQAAAMGLGQETLQRIIGRTAVDTEVSRLGLTASDKSVAEQIQAIPAFAGPTGSFDHTTFLRAVGEAGFTEQSFIAAIRSDTARTQLLNATSNGLQAPPGYVRALFDYLNEVRAVHYLVLPANAGDVTAKPTDAELLSYVKAHADRFSTPEYRQLTYASIAPADVMNQISVTDAQLKQEYEVRQSQYQIAEKRDVEQITFPDEKTAADASAKIAAGTSFEDLATARGLKPADIQLGTVAAADLGKERGAAAFALAEGGTSKPVKGTFGWVLLKVTKITPGVSKSFDEVKESLRTDVMQKLAVSKLTDLVNAFEDATSGGDTLAEAAKKSGMHVVHVASVDRQGLAADGTKSAVPQTPEFLSEVFKAEVGVAGDPFQTKDATFYVLMVEGDTPPKLRPLDQVGAQATAEWLAAQKQKLLLEKARSLTAQATAEKSLADIAKTLGVSEEASGALQRGAKSQVFADDLVTAIFDAAPGAAVYGKSSKGDSYIIARVTGIAHPPQMSASNPQYRSFLAQIGTQIGEDIPTSLAMAARLRQGVTVNQKMVDSVTGAGS